MANLAILCGKIMRDLKLQLFAKTASRIIALFASSLMTILYLEDVFGVDARINVLLLIWIYVIGGQMPSIFVSVGVRFRTFLQSLHLHFTTDLYISEDLHLSQLKWC